ncbi:Dihydrolipoyllysine-residue acetyltransferase component of acetoin cleaving system [Madurella mycetomatis]|uniref:Dihydrolipoyllysine-residue acetyltransferase component of acetoin cleaving system n=1 Tax=Madurella mycetomatis TaxID=100816 RepID=A0A175WHY4_9PEZI|nr:Dihydrolipoyllysine-residue acetyltransferase component of acetoin cleaving system [Madurella mycetomatis]
MATTATPPPQNLDPSRGSNPEQDPKEEPFHLSVNPACSETIIFLHGLLSSYLEYALVTPHLPEYHLLLVDLPGHSKSASATCLADPGSRLTVPAMADAVAALVRRRAHSGGRAHVVGLSMGGFVALDLARRYPELCLSVFVTGAAPFQGAFKFLAQQPWVVYGLMGFMLEWIPDEWYWWAVRNGWGMERRFEELKAEMGRNRRWELVKTVYGSILECLGWEEVRGIDRVRVLCVAAGKQDDVNATREVGQVWKGEGITERLGSKAAVVREAVHAWDLQFPELFAEGVKAWIEGRQLPQEFESL